MNTAETAWLAGLLEGEGSFFWRNPSPSHGPGVIGQPKIQLSMTDEDVVRRAAYFMGNAVCKREDKRPGHSPTFCVHLAGERAVLLMQEIRPWMGSRRGEKIDELVSRFQNRAKAAK